jgi:hypothetical protein
VYGGYAAGDAVRFNGTSEAIDRCKKMQADTKRTDPMKQAEQAAGGKEQYAQRTLAAVRQKIEEAQAGICTTFACAVADVLTEGTRQNPRSARVEIFATQRGLGTHLYVVVGRELGSVRDNPSTWGSQCRVVDCWAMAMGWATGPVQDPHHWPSNYWMLKKVASHYDSLKPDPDPNALAARGLERLVTAEQTQAERRRVQQSQATAPPEGVGKVPCPKCGLQFAQALLKNHMAKCTGSS